MFSTRVIHFDLFPPGKLLSNAAVTQVDELMRRGFKGATERDVERQLDQVILIFRYLNDKDVTRQLSQRFFPQPQFIKKCIESLLEREYLERDASDSKMYIYMA
ncbi:hypothetical protein JL721_6783 [Aureococcus anophagefferens]|nr:hypothetical protein JL721_6783 [Aureococcus anophagefferens]KAH8091609.1 hypothetical protein JL720_5921 [Aureococcus anophagefferens]